MIAQCVADIVKRHVKLTVEGIDRMYLNVVPKTCSSLPTYLGGYWGREPGLVVGQPTFEEHRFVVAAGCRS